MVIDFLVVRFFIILCIRIKIIIKDYLFFLIIEVCGEIFKEILI